ncbi:MAG TPA: pyruvate formate lyase family protein [Spirochaetia bacterium]|nr:pyruvate formate lyase family protein [Spirochaetia bacterium]
MPVDASPRSPRFALKTPKDLSPRITRLRDYYFAGMNRPWNNEFTAWTTGEPWDFQFNEMTFYIVPETYAFLTTFRSSLAQAARKVEVPPGFWKRSIAERRAWFIREVMTNRVPHEILPGDLIAGARFNVMTSCCMTKREAARHERLVRGKRGARQATLWFHNHGYGNAGATSGHLIPDYPRVLSEGWRGIHADLRRRMEALSPAELRGPRGGELRAMLEASIMARDVAARYAEACHAQAAEAEEARRAELLQMEAILRKVPWEPAVSFWEAVQSLWLTHMLVMSDENYPGPGLSFGRIDQYLLPYWEESRRRGMTRQEGKEILQCFWVHCNTAYDAMIRTGGNQGITAGYGQLLSLSGLGPGGQDMTNDLTYAILEVIDEMSPILEPKPNVRLHRGSPDALLDKIVDMVAGSQGAPFLLNFDERSMAGMMLEARKSGSERLISPANVFDYASVGCLENTMPGNDRSGTVDANLNLLKAVELALTGGWDLVPFVDPMTGKAERQVRRAPRTPDPSSFDTFEKFWNAYAEQTRFIVRRIVELYEMSEAVRARFLPTPYLSCLVRGCAEKGLDVTQGGAELGFVTIEAVTFATTVDSLLAVKYLVFDRGECTMEELIRALKANWVGYEKLQALARNRAPKYGRDDEQADALGRRVMELWTSETWKHRTQSTDRQFRPGMLSWNYWISDGFILPASPDGRPRGRFLSNAICPSNGADTYGPTANANSVGTVIGGREDGPGAGSFCENLLPNGGSHTITFNPSLVRDAEHRRKLKGFLRGYCRNGGTALQINMLDADMLRDAQAHPEDYHHLLVRVTGYNAYFTGVGRELQDEIIARESHGM